MNDYCFIVLFCTIAALDAGTSGIVWLRDLNNDVHKRHIDLGFSEELRFILKAEKKSINLHLKENPHVRADTDIYVIKEMPDGTKRAVKEPFTDNLESKHYHDIENGAVFTVRCSMRARGPCARTLEGILRIGDKYFHIAPVSDLNKVDSFDLNREYQDTPHLIREEMEIGEDIRLKNDTIKLIDPKDESVEKSPFVNLQRSSDNLNVGKSHVGKNKRATTVYGIELLVVVDPPVWEKFYALAGNDTENANTRVREYVAQVITGVAHIFNTIQGRSFSIEVTVKAIAIIQNTTNGPYAIAKPYKQNGRWSIDDRDYLPEFNDWVVNTPGLLSRSEIDVAIMLSGCYNLILYKRILQKRNIELCVAYIRSACHNHGVALVTEAGYYRTIMLFCHELAHNLGADEDEEVGCPSGNIMGMDQPNLLHEYSHKPWEFSECSIADFEKYLSEQSCVKDKATFIEDYDNYNTNYPGQMYDAEQQCKIGFGLDSYICDASIIIIYLFVPKLEKICVSLYCYNPTNGNCGRNIAADGTQCGTGNMWCIEGQCVSKCKKTPTPKSTTTTVKGTTIPSSTKDPSCKDSDACKMLYTIYKRKKRFCSDLGEVCCKMCKGKTKCENIGFMDLKCTDLRKFYSSKRKFCSKWSKNCCKACSKMVTG
ncbi:hypothetical protein ACJMK2_018061 [Sinanodonta woodiana]|uniref:Peptidase M12B domain-containing protein n=1 Tax=Sinanodonta woodiana TaxID=1069815 RepID=A0ABD3UCC1_SINWO